MKAPQLPPSAMVTRPGHPLQGQELRVLGWMRRHGALELLLELADGSKRLIPAAWTGLAGENAGTGQAAAVTLGKTAGLLAACALVRRCAPASRAAGSRLHENHLPGRTVVQPVQLSLLPDLDRPPAVTISQLPRPDTVKAVLLLAGLMARAALTSSPQSATGSSNAVA